MDMTNTRSRWLPLVVLLSVLVACPKAPETFRARDEYIAETGNEAGSRETKLEPSPPEQDQGAGLAAPERCPVTTIYFGFDQSVPDETARQSLRELAACLSREGAAALLVLEGHADDRGTTIYNTALSAKRAASAAQYLEDLGIQVPTDIKPMGEEWPATPVPVPEVDARGFETPASASAREAAWARNRRVVAEVLRKRAEEAPAPRYL